VVVDDANRRFSGKVAIVTGSTADPSIGRSCALHLARQGARVVINGRDAARLKSTEVEMQNDGLEVTGVVGSMDTRSAVKILVDRAVEAFGGLDLIVSTLGGAPHPLSFEAITEAELLETMKLNIWPLLVLTRAALHDGGLAEGGGSVVAISSGSPRKTTSKMISYAAAKAALNAVIRTMAAELAPRGVRVNAVSPGLVRTTSTRSTWEDDGGRAAGSALPLGRLTEADDVADAVTFLLSNDARQITGITLDVDGGNHLVGGGWTPIR
jgi:3-oxoacyl-[acyl-carrier protein] reductase